MSEVEWDPQYTAQTPLGTGYFPNTPPSQNPYNSYSWQDTSQKARVLPGVRPNVGYVPGEGSVDLRSFLPTNWNQEHPGFGVIEDSNLTPLEDKVTNFFSGAPFAPFPLYKDTPMYGDKRGLSGRGYQYYGSPSAQEEALKNEILGGNINPGTLLPYDKLSRQRISENPLSGMQKFAQQYYGPLLVSTVGSMATGPFGPVVGPALGALWGAGTQYAMSHGEANPWELAAGAAGGAAGGYAGGAAAGAMGAAPGGIAAGAASGAGASLGSSIGRGAVTGKWDAYDIAKNAGIGAVSGGVGGAINSYLTNPATGKPYPYAGPVSKVGSAAVGAGFNAALPSSYDDDTNRRRRLNPYQGRR